MDVFDYVKKTEKIFNNIDSENVSIGTDKYINLLSEERDILQERIDKAIEYINEYRNGLNDWFEFTIQDKIQLLQILKGDK